MNSYELSRNYFDWCFENPEKITPNHTAIYFFAVEHCNRLGWKEKFGLPSQMVMDAIGIKNWRTYIKAFNDLTEWGFFELIQKSKNQYSSNIIAIVNNTKATTKALDKAMQKHVQKQGQSIVSINKPNNNKQKTDEQTIAPTKVDAVEPIDFEKLLSFINFSFGRKFQVINKKVRASFNARIKEGYTKDQITDAINNCKEIAYHKEKNYQYCTPEFFSRSEILDKYSNVTKQEKKVYAFHPVIFD
jgi:uncharacterized phage protein (TIGR02220 family)